ncbi:hypothetical protein [Serratia fonticola]|uniref:Uncharacterized protein n=1 Tax=Serratia fonticola TaxID=47917 RepID=A0AAW3WW24_SERFO|nr:hypothetical protein [Serratia fonticola]MBC3215113.1 hypothetical protein [Serratia fonticola]NYA14357.1 hypothetical protein [Serratia fonticola]NYA33999.1 hypothetical protein [Serratia fonticola]
MKLTNYHHSLLKKISFLFYGKTISNIIIISDEDDDLIDNVRFFELENGGVVGFYINGSNPLISINHIYEFDDFNLYASYSTLSENKECEFLPFKVEFIKVFFHPEYNEVISIFLSSSDFSFSISIVFSTDEIHTHMNCKKDDLTKMIKEDLVQFEDIDFITCQMDSSNDNWSYM